MGAGRPSKDQNTQNRFSKTPHIKGWLIIFLINLNLLVGVDDVPVFHDGLILLCGKTVKKVSQNC
jgi:hypothetical protein